jgi:hypothetical protein
MAVLTERELEEVYDEADYTPGLRSALFSVIAGAVPFITDPVFYLSIAPTIFERFAQVEAGMLDVDPTVAERDTYRARKLVGAMRKLEEIGPGEVEIRGGEDSEWLKLRTERGAWIEYALDVLYREGPNPVDTLPGAGGVLLGSGPAYVARRTAGVTSPLLACGCDPRRCRCVPVREG